MARKLNSDQLGKKGEARFPELCTDAGLIPNPATWDRKGWDFVVDWPFDDTGPLDSRPTPFSCLVQLKTIWQGAKAVRLRLSSLEHIAKDAKPSFLFVLEVNNNLNFVGAHVAHIEGDLLGHVLKALRQARIDGTAPNKIHMTLSLATWFAPLAPTGVAARAAFEAAIGSSMRAYAGGKQRQLLDLGFGKDRLSVTTTFEAGQEELWDAFLGLRKLENVLMKGQENRFGLAIPRPDMFPPSRGELEITLEPHDTCEIGGRDTSDGREFRFRGEVYGLPAHILPPNRIRFLIRADMFSILVDGTFGDEEVSPKITLTLEQERIAQLKLRAADWLNLHAFLAALGRNKLELFMKSTKVGHPLVSAVTAQFNLATVDQWSLGERIAAIADAALSNAGCPGTKLSLKTLVDVSKQLMLLDALMNAPASLSPLHITVTPTPGSEKPAFGEPIPSLYFGLIKLERHYLVYVATIDLVPEPDGEDIRWTGSNYSFRDIARIKATIPAYDRFVTDTQRRTGIKSFIARGTGEDQDAPAISD